MKSKTKRWFGQFIAVILTVCLFMGGGLAEVSKNIGDGIGTLVAYAASSTTAGGFTWELDDNGVLTITGSGEMPSYDWSNSSFSKSQVKKVVIVDGITTVKSYILSDCTALTSVIIADSVTVIEDNAFNNCKNLKTVNLSSNLKTMKTNAFANTSIESITIPKSLKECTFSNTWGYYDFEDYDYNLYAGPFYKCEKLKSITFETGCTAVPEWTFSGCVGLKTVNLPDSITTIGEYAFRGCLRLESLSMGNSITSIGACSFEDCVSLTNLTIPDNVTVIEDNAFNNCKNLTVFCPQYSVSSIYMIDNDIPFISNSSVRKANLDDVLEFSSSLYSTNFSSVTNSGSIGFVCEYEFKENKFNNVSDKKVVIRIPKDSEIIEKTLKYNGVICTNYSENNNKIIIPVTSLKGKITFSVKKTSADVKITSYAIMQYKVSGKSTYEIIGVTNEKVPSISIETGSVINSSRVSVSGIAPPETNIDLYVDNTKIATAKSNKVGVYSATINITEPVDGTTYVLKAQSVSDSKLYAQTKVNYSESNPVLNGFSMNYNGKDYDLTTGIKHSITFNGGYKYSFELDFDKPEYVDKVYVISTRNNMTKYLEATKDEKTGRFVADGYFDENDHGYVPGTLSVEYIKPREEYSIEKNQALYNQVVEKTKENFNGIQKTVSTPSADTTEYSFDLADVPDFSDLGSKIAKLSIKQYSKTSPVDWYGIASLYDDYYSYFVDEGSSKYYVNLDFSKPKTYVMIVDDVVNNKIVQYELNDVVDTLLTKNSHVDTALNLSSGLYLLGYLGEIKKAMDISDDYNDLVDKINASDLPWSEKQTALKKAKELKQDRELYLALSFVITAVAGPGALPVSLLMGVFNIAADYFFAYREAGILEGGYSAKVNWSIDPSGYVYEAVTSNRLSDVTTTAYWIPFDEENDDETFWNEPQTVRAEIWNASEWSQQNPLITDNDGNYSWDVPEGWWQVKYEKEGYETIYSDWLPVPPPQTDVNIGMVSSKETSVSSVNVTSSNVSVIFDNYVDPATVSSIVIKDASGSNISYTLGYSSDETDNSGKVWAKEYKLNTSSTADTVVIPKTIRDYAGRKVCVPTETSTSLKNNSVTSSTTVNLGDAMTVTAKAVGGTKPYTYAVYYKKASATEWTTVQSYKENAVVTIKPTVAVKYDICVSVKDKTGQIEKKYFTVDVINPLTNVSTISSDSVIKGKPITVTAKASGGTKPYTYAVYYKKANVTAWTTVQAFADNTSVTITPTDGKYNICVKVKDKTGQIEKKYFTVDVTDTLTNNSTLSATTVRKDETITITAKATGGTAPYQYAFYYSYEGGTAKTLKAYSTSAKAVFSASAAGKYSLIVKIKDTSGKVVRKDFDVVVYDKSYPLKSTSKISSANITLGNKVKITAGATGGTGYYQYAFYYRKSGETNWKTIRTYGAECTTYFKPANTGNYEILTKVKDSNNKIVKSTFSLTVTAANTKLQFDAIFNRTVIYAGQDLCIETIATGGTGFYKYGVYFKKKTDTKWTTVKAFSAGNETGFTLPSSGEYEVCVKVRDSSNSTVKKYYDVTANLETVPICNLSTVSAKTINLGESITMTGACSGGTSCYEYLMIYRMVGNDQEIILQNYGANNIVTFKPEYRGTYELCIKVADFEGANQEKWFTLTVK